MATVVTQPKPTFTMKVNYQSKDGSYKIAEAKREFTPIEAKSEITVSCVADDGKPFQVKRAFNRLVANTPAELLAILENDPLFTLVAFAYGSDLLYRQVIKVPIANEEEGPGKVLLKQAESLIASRAKLGLKAISIERAMELVKSQMEAE